jgi:hypothetical protein
MCRHQNRGSRPGPRPRPHLMPNESRPARPATSHRLPRARAGPARGRCSPRRQRRRWPHPRPLRQRRPPPLPRRQRLPLPLPQRRARHRHPRPPLRRRRHRLRRRHPLPRRSRRRPRPLIRLRKHDAEAASGGRTGGALQRLWPRPHLRRVVGRGLTVRRLRSLPRPAASSDLCAGPRRPSGPGSAGLPSDSAGALRAARGRSS